MHARRTCVETLLSSDSKVIGWLLPHLVLMPFPLCRVAIDSTLPVCGHAIGQPYLYKHLVEGQADRAYSKFQEFWRNTSGPVAHPILVS